MSKKIIYVIAGGTINKVSPHFALSAPAYGTVGRKIVEGFLDVIDDHSYIVYYLPTTMALATLHDFEKYDYDMILSKAGIDKLETNDDMSKLVDWSAQN